MTGRLGLHPSTRFPVPDETTAPAPAEHRGVPRDGVRLLVARTPDDIRHRVFRDLPDELLPGDLVVVNTSATIAAEADATSTMRGAVVVHVATLLDDGTWVVELRTAPDARRAILDARPGEAVSLDGATLTLLAPYPRRALLPDRRRQPTVARRRRGRPAAHPRPHRPAHRLRLPRPPLPAGRLPDGVRHRPGQRRDAVGGAPVHRRPRHPADREGRRRQPDHAAHRPELAGGRRGPAGRALQRAAGHRRGRQRGQGSRRPRGRRRHDGHPRPGDRRRSRRPRVREQRVDRAGDLPRRPGPRRRRPDHRLARPRGLPPDARRVCRRPRADPGGVRRGRRGRVPLARVRRLRAAAASRPLVEEVAQRPACSNHPAAR